MNLSIHPDADCRKKQSEFLSACPSEHRRFHELLFIYGNITYHYHKQAREFNPTQLDWQEWIEGLEDPMKTKFRKDGFEKCKGVLSFTRYVNEKNDIGLDEFVRQHMDSSDYLEYQNIKNQSVSTDKGGK